MRGISLHAICISLSTLSLLNSAATASDMVPWVEDINTARQIAAARNQLILVHFFSNNCPPCRNLETNVFSQPGFGHGVARGYVPVRINVSVSPDLARQFKVDRWPMDVVMTASGQEIHRMVSPQDGNEYLRILNQISWRASNIPNGMDPQLATRGFADSTPRSAVSSVAVSQYQLGQQPEPDGGGDAVVANAAAGLTSTASNSLASTASNLPYGENLGPRLPPSPPPTQTVSHGISVGPNMMHPTNEFISPQQDFPAQVEMDRQPQMIENRFAHVAGTAASNQTAPGNIAPQTASNAPLSAPAASPATPPRRADAGVAAGQTRVASAEDVISSAPAPAATVERKPEIGMEGYCPVTLIEEDRWVRGDKRWGARHRGRVYLFHSAAAQQKFLAEPDRYSPALTGYDPVVFSEDGRYAEGMRAHGLRYHGQIFLFQNEASLAKFAQEPNRYAEVVRLAVGADRKTIR